MSRAALIGLLLLVVATTVSVLAAANDVPPTRAGIDTDPAGANELKPSECDSLTLTNKVSGTGTFNGSSGADLIVGSASADTIDGADGTDCIVGGDGDDSLKGGAGTDVCLGRGGTDTFDPDCETAIQ